MTTLILAAALIAQCPGGVCPPRVVVQAAPLKFDASPNMTEPWCSLGADFPTSPTPKATRRRSSKASGSTYQAPSAKRGIRLFRRCR